MATINIETPETPETWIEIQYQSPCIPLAKGVPVGIYGNSIRTVVLFLFEDGSGFHLYGHGDVDVDDNLWRVDLADPQGFGYALRWYFRTRSPVALPHAERRIELAARNWMHGETTDADRIALARSIAEVSR